MSCRIMMVLGVAVLTLTSCNPNHSVPQSAPGTSDSHAAARAEPGGQTSNSVWQARPLAGPFASLEEFCQNPAHCNQELSHDIIDDVPGIDPAAIPWTTRVVSARGGWEDAEDYMMVHLLFETEYGWFALLSFERDRNRYRWRIEDVHVVGSRVALYSSNEEGRFATNHQNRVTVCDVGPSEGPSCIGPVVLRASFIGWQGGKEDGHPLPEEVYFDCAADLDDDGRLVITAQDQGCRDQPGLAGEHILYFP